MRQNYVSVPPNAHVAGLPTATDSQRGQVRILGGDGTTTGDKIYLCRRTASGAFEFAEFAMMTDLAAYVVTDTLAQSLADTGSTTSTTNYANAATLNVTLPSGTWDVKAVGGLGISNTGGRSNFQITIGGTAGPNQTLTVTTLAHAVTNAEKTGVAGGGVVAVAVQFKSLDAGTTTARNPWLMVTAIRTA